MTVSGGLKAKGKKVEAVPLGVLEGAVIDLSLAIEQVRRRLRSATNPATLNLNHLGTLLRLEQKGWQSPAELARAESMKPQSMADILKNLEDAGIVERRAHPTDGRKVQFGLTLAGVETRRQRKLAKREWLLDALSKLSADEQRRLIEAIPLIRRLGDN